MKLSIKDLDGNPQGEVDVTFEVIENGRGTQAVHDTVVAFRAAQRMGTACTKTVGEVAGTNKKPWRQKGTGRARAGSFRSPLWAGGGVVFGPKPRDYTKKVNNRTRKLALRKALSERIKAGDVVLVDKITLESPKTKGMIAVLAKLDARGSTLVVDSEVNKNLRLASRNLEKVQVTTSDFLNTYQVLWPDKLVISRAAFEKIEARLKD